MNEFLPKKITDAMMHSDAFSQWLNITRKQDDYGKSTLEMKVRPEMLNGFGIVHGGVTFALADSALAFAANSHGIQSVSVENSIHYHKPSKAGDVLTAVASEVTSGKRIGCYAVEIFNQNDDLIATFKGSVLRAGKKWEV